jgi:hypothetical protein
MDPRCGYTKNASGSKATSPAASCAARLCSSFLSRNRNEQQYVRSSNRIRCSGLRCVRFPSQAVVPDEMHCRKGRSSLAVAKHLKHRTCVIPLPSQKSTKLESLHSLPGSLRSCVCRRSPNLQCCQLPLSIRIVRTKSDTCHTVALQ